MLEAGEHAQQRGLAAARRADEDDELALGDVDGDAVQDLDGAEGFAKVADRYRSHDGIPLWLPVFRCAGSGTIDGTGG